MKPWKQITILEAIDWARDRDPPFEDTSLYIDDGSRPFPSISEVSWPDELLCFSDGSYIAVMSSWRSFGDSCPTESQPPIWWLWSPK